MAGSIHHPRRRRARPGRRSNRPYGRTRRPRPMSVGGRGLPTVAGYEIQGELGRGRNGGGLQGWPHSIEPSMRLSKMILAGGSASPRRCGPVCDRGRGNCPTRGSINRPDPQVKTTEPVPLPSQLVPGMPRDMETICLKCLQKEPGKRYATARAGPRPEGLFLDHEPIHARSQWGTSAGGRDGHGAAQFRPGCSFAGGDRSLCLHGDPLAVEAKRTPWRNRFHSQMLQSEERRLKAVDAQELEPSRPAMKPSDLAKPNAGNLLSVKHRGRSGGVYGSRMIPPRGSVSPSSPTGGTATGSGDTCTASSTAPVP